MSFPKNLEFETNVKSCQIEICFSFKKLTTFPKRLLVAFFHSIAGILCQNCWVSVPWY